MKKPALNNKKRLIEARDACLKAEVGQPIVCPSCNTVHTKNSYQTVFCKSKSGTQCKDFYWNNVDPKKRNNKTRISPANAAYYHSVILPEKAREFGFPDVETMQNHIEEDDGTWDAHQCQVENCQWCGFRPEYCRCD